MALQDDIFDVRDALKKKPELEAFDRLMEHMNALESANEEMGEFIDGLKVGARAFKKLFQGKL